MFCSYKKVFCKYVQQQCLKEMTENIFIVMKLKFNNCRILFCTVKIILKHSWNIHCETKKNCCSISRETTSFSLFCISENSLELINFLFPSSIFNTIHSISQTGMIKFLNRCWKEEKCKLSKTDLDKKCFQLHKTQ